VLHITAAMCFVALASFLEPSLKSLASLFMPHVLQGRTFGVLTLLAGLGEQVGQGCKGCSAQSMQCTKDR
jgi:hypothetical protein